MIFAKLTSSRFITLIHKKEQCQHFLKELELNVIIQLNLASGNKQTHSNKDTL